MVCNYANVPKGSCFCSVWNAISLLAQLWKRSGRTMSQLYIKKVFDQIEGPVKKVFKLWDGSVAVEMRLHQ